MTPGKEIQPPTVEDVAAAAGVSTATVSRCLNTSARVAESTRARVMAAVEQLGYTPNFGARALAAKRTFTIGAIIPTMENAIFAQGLQAFQERLNARGYTLLVSSTGYDPQAEAEQIRALVARGADGLLLIGYERPETSYDFLSSRNVPFLLSWAYQNQMPYAAIGFDNRAAMRAMAEAVLAKGHRTFGIISGILDGNDRAADRVSGIVDAVEHFGLDPKMLQIVETPYGIQNGADAFGKLMQSARRPSAVLCINDVLAAGAMRHALDMGLDVPGDVSITGFDDIDLAELLRPALATVHVPHAQMGGRAADALIDMVEGAAPSAPEELTSKLKLRTSLGPPPIEAKDL